MRARIVIAIVIVAGLVSCSGDAVTDHFELVEFAVHGPTQLDMGTEAVVVANSGTFPHTLVVTDSESRVVTASSLLQPGESVDLDLDLESGTYSFTCRIVVQTPDGDLVDHFERGMATSVEVTG